jgi:hypothetical protein
MENGNRDHTPISPAIVKASSIYFFTRLRCTLLFAMASAFSGVSQISFRNPISPVFADKRPNIGVECLRSPSFHLSRPGLHLHFSTSRPCVFAF